MHALVLNAPNRLEWQDVPDPSPAPDEVLVRVKACGICGSDVHGMDGSTGRRRPPIVMGHEAAGTIAAVGRDVDEWQTGERVTFDSTVYCGQCAYCLQGRVNLCDSRRVLGVSCEEYRRDGAFAEFVAIPSRILYRLPDAVSFEHAAMVEPVSVAVHTVARALIRPVQSALVVGAGMIGLLIVQVLRARGVAAILVSDVDATRRDLAKRMGATDTLDPAIVDVPNVTRDRTAGDGVDCTFDAVGIAVTVATAIESTCKGGTVVLVGNLAPEVTIPLQRVVTRELSLFGSCASAGEYPECLELMASGNIDVTPLITAKAPMHEGAAWFEKLYQHEPGLMKVILEP